MVGQASPLVIMIFQIKASSLVITFFHLVNINWGQLNKVHYNVNRDG